MVLKRFLTTALGAMGLGALAAGTASAQEIPAPNLFDGQVACSMNVPTPPMSLGTAVTAKVMSGMAISLDADGVPTDGTSAGGTDDSGLANILYVIDPNNSNCGAGTYTQAEFDAATAALGSGMEGFAVGDPKPVAGQIAMDVGAGYTDTLMKFMAANMADQGVKDAEAALKALTDLQAPGADDTPDITTARENLTAAMTARDNARTALAAVSMGPINMAGLAEWRAKGKVEMAIADWNTAVMAAVDANTALGPTEYNNKYVMVDSDQLLALTSGDVTAANINLVNLRQYANADGSNASTQDSMTGAIIGDSAFDALGNLILPMETWDHDNDTNTPEVLRVNPEDTSTYTVVNDRLTAVNNMVKALEDLQGSNQNVLMQPVIDEAVKRAKIEQAHYQTQFNTMIADNTDLRTPAQLALQYIDSDSSGTIEVDERTADNERTEETDFARTDYVSMKTNYDGLQMANTNRDNAGVELASAVMAREMATTAVRTAFTSPQDFYQQLVDRRSYQKDQADADVMKLAGMTGDDAPTQAVTEAAEKAAMDAAAALTAAEEIQMSFQGMLAEDSPVRDLVLETLLPDEGMGQGDDGQALVDAIVGVHDTANDAKMKAEETAGMIEGLTGDEGEVSMNTTRSMQNESDIEALDGRVAMNEGEIWDEDGNSRIDANETRSMANATMIKTNAENITTNAGNIATNAGNILTNTMEIGYGEDGMSRIDHNEARSMQNADDIMENAGHIMENRGMIQSNAADISSNADDIAANMSSIGSNRSSIMRNADMIGGLQDQMEVVRAGVAASMALAGMPAINGRGISLGVGSFDGESAFAVGFQIQGEMASFKVGVTSAGGETGASAGVGFQF